MAATSLVEVTDFKGSFHQHRGVLPSATVPAGATALCGCTLRTSAGSAVPATCATARRAREAKARSSTHGFGPVERKAVPQLLMRGWTLATGVKRSSHF